MVEATEQTETVEEVFQDDLYNAAPWLADLKDADKVFKSYHERCDNIDKHYADLERLSKEASEREMQVFWANLEVLKPSIYSRPPVPVVVPRYKDTGNDAVASTASQLLERDLVTSFDLEDINETMICLRDDLATNSRGVAWIRYEVTGEYDNEKVCYDHIDRKDFLHDPARKWKEVGWVARRTWLSRNEGGKRFAEREEIFAKADFKDNAEDTDEKYKREKKAAVWEIWSKDKGVVVWVTEGVEEVLDIQRPFLDLERFFPCPRPAYGTTQRSSLVPVPDFLYYKDQLEEINELTARISALSGALRMKGFYGAGQEDLSSVIEKAIRDVSNSAILVPVPNMAAMGGAALKDSIVWLPVNEVAQTIQALIALRKEIISDVYEITGLSDIMRGATDPDETLGAQQLKSQYGSVRIRDKQAELVRIARDLSRMAGEIMAENFSPETMLAMAQMQLPTEQQIEQKIQEALQNPQVQELIKTNPAKAQEMAAKARATVTVDKVMMLLREQRVRPFVLDIETDSTIQPDENADKQRRTEFLTALGSSLQQLGPMVQQQPQTAGFAGEILKFAVAPFRAGRELESTIDDFVEQMKSYAQQPKANPEQEAQQADAQRRQQEFQMEAEFKSRDRAQQLEFEQEKHQMKIAELKLQLAIKEQEADLKIGAAAAQAAIKNSSNNKEAA